MGKFKKGIFLGGILGAGLAWFNLTGSGKKMRAKLFDGAQKVYGDIEKTVLASNLKNTITKQQYYKMVRDYVNKHADKFEWADNVKNMMTKIVSSQWKNLQDEIKKLK